ncbi:MAG TPA: L,D-transpeptidase [Acidimicrobiales bacterium]|nr:L,D-transpeptidase [Acidimicrobiales bacterium]
MSVTPVNAVAWPFAEGATAVVARAAVDRVPLYGRAGAPLPWRYLDHPDAFGLPVVFLVVGCDGEWLRVKVPLRPNGSTAWVRADDVRLTETRYRLDVSVSARRLTLRWGARVVLDAPVAVGKPRTPTPVGDFYVESSVKRDVPDPLYGVYALGLSGFSEVLHDFNGGEGRLGIHGTGRPDLIGRAVTAGCIRLRDDHAEEVSRRVPLGTPVRIRP